MQDDIEKVLRDIMPQLHDNITQEFKEKFKLQQDRLYEQEIRQLQQQAQTQFQQVFAIIKNEQEMAVSSKISELDNEITQLKHWTREHEQKLKNKKIQEFQEQYVLQHIEDEVLKHPMFIQIKDRIDCELREKFEERFNIELVRREKQLLIRLKQKEDKEFEDLQREYQKKCQKMVEEAQSKLDKNKVELARLRSETNIKIKKIVQQKKQLDQRYQKDEEKYMSLVGGLEAQLLQARKEITDRYEEYQEEEQQPEMEQVEESSEEEEVPQPQPIKLNPIEQDLTIELPVRTRILEKNTKSYMQLFNSLLSPENRSDNLPQINVSDTFERDLSKYLPTDVDISRKKHTSSFREEYEKQLCKMGGARSRLTAAAKNIIMENIMREVGVRKKSKRISIR